MGDRAPFVVGILAIAGVVAWLVLRDDKNATPDKPPAEASGSAEVTGPAKISAPEGPTLPADAKAPEPTGPTADDAFIGESRDETWAKATEADLRNRWKKIRGAKLDSLECRDSQCKAIVIGSENEVAQTVADLEGARGLHGFAQNVQLTNPTKTDKGMSLQIFVRFDKDKKTPARGGRPKPEETTID